MTQARLDTRLVETRGLRFEVAACGAGDRLALLLHGFPDTPHSYRRQMPLLARLGYRVWAPYLRGYGKSDKPRGVRAYTLDALENDVTDLIDASGARSVLLVGHDWGGGIAWSYAMHGTRPLERLVVLNSPHPECLRRGLRTRAQLARSWYMFFFQLPWLPELLLRARDCRAITDAVRGTAVHPEHFSDEDMEVLRRNAREPGALTAMLNYYRAMRLSGARTRDRGVATIRVPTLLLWGERDQALGKELTYGTERFVENLTIRYLPDASHWVQQDAPEAVNAILEEWLAEPSVAHAADKH
ncbi:MAG TPA: alpha/beta fold hydrolase [Polyangiaceae bacterium]|nr:alpha/beta fold hydrolase [Polyangiaceae bacterium]